MVLICGKDSPLSIEQFHKNRCMEKAEIKNIIINRKYMKDAYKEDEPKEEKAMINSTYLKTVEETQMRSSNAINLSGYNCKRR